jgi:hypothetical protein
MARRVQYGRACHQDDVVKVSRLRLVLSDRVTPPDAWHLTNQPPSQLREQVIDQLARIGKALNPTFDVNKFKAGCK